MEPRETRPAVNWNHPLWTLSGLQVVHIGDIDTEDSSRPVRLSNGVTWWYSPEGHWLGKTHPELDLTNTPPTASTSGLGASPEVSPSADFGLDWLLGLHEDTCEAARETMKAKNHDYTNGSDNVFANFEGADFLNVHPVVGILIRTMDKFKRIETFVSQGKLEVAGEAVEDAIEDSINYLILAKAMIAQRYGA